jgi:hypothetical protein
MRKRENHFWRKAVRTFFVPLFAWVLVAQAIMLPLARAGAVERAGQDAALAIICAPTLPIPGETGEDSGHRQVHDLGCCTLNARHDPTPPLAVAAPPLPLSAPARVATRIAYALPQGRAPPAITAQPRSARAPPIPA